MFKITSQEEFLEVCSIFIVWLILLFYSDVGEGECVHLILVIGRNKQSNSLVFTLYFCIVKSRRREEQR